MSGVEPIVEERPLVCDPATAFRLFSTDLSSWWPREYSFSQDALERLWIEPQVSGTARERDAEGNEIVWGFVVACDPGGRLTLRWMIEPARTLQPDPARASRLTLTWSPEGDGCRVRLVHDEFDRHVADPGPYRDGLAGSPGWPRLMDLYAEACARV